MAYANPLTLALQKKQAVGVNPPAPAPLAPASPAAKMGLAIGQTVRPLFPSASPLGAFQATAAPRPVAPAPTGNPLLDAVARAKANSVPTPVAPATPKGPPPKPTGNPLTDAIARAKYNYVPPSNNPDVVIGGPGREHDNVWVKQPNGEYLSPTGGHPQDSGGAQGVPDPTVTGFKPPSTNPFQGLTGGGGGGKGKVFDMPIGLGSARANASRGRSTAADSLKNQDGRASLIIARKGRH